jgi:two-component system sensor kinase FixL
VLGAAIMGSSVIGVWTLLNDSARNHINSITDYELQMTDTLLKADIKRRLTALDRLAQRWTKANGTPRRDWEADATRYLADMPGFEAIAWADSALHIQWLVPVDSDRTALQGLNLSKIEPELMAISEARASGGVKLSQPFKLAHGNLSVMVFAAVTRDNKFDGMIVGVLALEPWLETVFAGLTGAEYQRSIFVGSEQIHQHQNIDASMDERWTRKSQSTIQGLQWTVLAAPTNAFVSAVHLRLTTLILIAGLPLSVLFGLIIYQSLNNRTRARSVRKTANQLETLFQNLPGMAYRGVLGKDISFEFLSEGCLQLTGYMPIDFSPGRSSFFELIHPDDRKRVSQIMQAAIDANEMYDLEYRIRAKDHQERWLWQRGRAVGPALDNAFRLEGFISDITDRKRTDIMLTEARALQQSTEENLRRDHERLGLIIEHTHMGIVTYRSGQPFITANSAFCKLTGYTVNELMSMTVADLTHPDDLAETAYLANKVNVGEYEKFSQRKRYIRKNGEIIDIQVVNAITHDADGKIDLFIAQVEDLTPRLTAEAEARQHLEHLAHAGRLNVLGEMASGIAHEINQPLTAISLFSQAGKRLFESGKLERIPEVFEKVSQHAQRAGAVIERVLNMAKQRESIKEVTDCNQLIRDVATLAEADARIRDIEITVKTAAVLPPVAIDTIQIQQVALNLLRNGMEAMRSVDCCNGARIEITTTLRDDGGVDIAIIDSGSGVSQEAEPKLFTPFQTTKEFGMGMGLSISQTIVTAHGGKLDFKNNESGGATFSFNLPAAT